MKGIQVDTWAIYHKIDFKNYTTYPTYKVMPVFGSQLLGATSSSGIMTAKILNMVRHMFEMEDDLIHFGQKTSRGNFFQLESNYDAPILKEKNEDILVQ